MKTPSLVRTWLRVPALALSLIGLLAACGGEPPPPPAPPPAPPAPPAAEPSAEPEAPPAATEEPDAGAPPEAPKPVQSGPIMLKSDPQEISDTIAIGQTAKLQIGEGEIATFKIPPGALSSGTNITFKLDKKAKPSAGLVGKVYHLTAIVPPESTPAEITSASEPFELVMPAGNKKDANLAIGAIDPANGKVSWQVIAPKRIDDAAGLAYFELPSFKDAYLHITTKAPSEAK